MKPFLNIFLFSIIYFLFYEFELFFKPTEKKLTFCVVLNVIFVDFKAENIIHSYEITKIKTNYILTREILCSFVKFVMFINFKYQLEIRY